MDIEGGVEAGVDVVSTAVEDVDSFVGDDVIDAVGRGIAVDG